MKRLFLSLLVLFICVFVEESFAGGSSRWKLDFSFQKPCSIILPEAGGKARTVWTMLYQVSNQTGEEQNLSIFIKATTDSGKAYWDLPDFQVEKAVKAKLKKKELFNAVSICGAMPDGEMREGIAIFGDVDRNMDILTVHVSGLMDVIVRERGKTYFEKKILNLHFKRTGDEYYVQFDPLKFVKKEWVVEPKKRLLF